MSLNHQIKVLDKKTISAPGTHALKKLEPRGEHYGFYIVAENGSGLSGATITVEIQHRGYASSDGYITLGEFANINADGTYYKINEQLTTIHPFSDVQLEVTAVSGGTSPQVDITVYACCFLPK